MFMGDVTETDLMRDIIQISKDAIMKEKNNVKGCLIFISL